MKRKLYETMGMKLLSLPVTEKNQTNNRRRNVQNMESVTAAHMISVTGINADNPLIFCGKHNKSVHILKQLAKMSDRPFALIGTERDLGADSVLRNLQTDWETDSVPGELQEGNGILVLSPGAETNLEMKAYLTGWHSHLLILCLGNGLQVDEELLNLLNSIGHYILLSENLQRSIKNTDGCRMQASDLLTSMEYILVSSIGMAGKELLKVLPDYEYEKITNTADISRHQDAPHNFRSGMHHRNGGGFLLSQSRTQEMRCIFTQDDLIRLQADSEMIIHNAGNSRTWVARITG